MSFLESSDSDLNLIAYIYVILFAIFIIMICSMSVAENLVRFLPISGFSDGLLSNAFI